MPIPCVFRKKEDPMSLSLAEIRKIVKPRKSGPGTSSIEIIDSWAEYEYGPTAGERPLEYLCYEIGLRSNPLIRKRGSTGITTKR